MIAAGLTNVRVASWNIAAVNNNPFEFWVTVEHPAYNKLMLDVERFIDEPANDLAVNKIFTDMMFEELLEEMRQQHMPNLEDLRRFWKTDYSGRMAVSGFLRDKTIGTKRLVSMPDRITNTINLQDGTTKTRPTVINAYDGGSLHSIEAWWTQWKTFMFHTDFQIFAGDRSTSDAPRVACKLLSPILRGKYPAITLEEQAISVQLQVLCLAIMDSIFIHVLNSVGAGIWEDIRRTLCNELIKNKASRVCRIIAESYWDADIIFIQEAAAIFVKHAQGIDTLADKYKLLVPHDVDVRRDQNSLILLDRRRFREASCVDVTSEVLSHIGGSWIAAGDLLVISAEDAHGGLWLLASFHGDSNGLSTQPAIRAINDLAVSRFPAHRLVVGLDANSYSLRADAYYHSVPSFLAFLDDQHMLSIWGAVPDPLLRTACSSRTVLQTQVVY